MFYNKTKIWLYSYNDEPELDIVLADTFEEAEEKVIIKKVNKSDKDIKINFLCICHDYEINIVEEKFKCYQNHDKKYYHRDVWDCATLWINDHQGVEYNFCIDGTLNLSAIYKMYGYENHLVITDYETFEHYKIDFNDENWKEELLKAMFKTAIKFFE